MKVCTVTYRFLSIEHKGREVVLDVDKTIHWTMIRTATGQSSQQSPTSVLSSRFASFMTTVRSAFCFEIPQQVPHRRWAAMVFFSFFSAPCVHSPFPFVSCQRSTTLPIPPLRVSAALRHSDCWVALRHAYDYWCSVVVSADDRPTWTLAQTRVGIGWPFMRFGETL